MATQPAWSAAEIAAREAYGRLVANLAVRSGDLAAAQDALGDALLAALEHWPRDGVPANPQAWLFTVARRRIIDGARKRVRAGAAQPELGLLRDAMEAAMNDEHAFPDERLGLMLACANPDVDPAIRTPLMLQAVLGLSAERMASAFLCSPAAMTKRLVRAKGKLTATGATFAVPGIEALAARMEPLLDAIYAAFTLARDDAAGSTLTGEAVWLGRLVAALAPDNAEAAGLLSLMLFVSARGRAASGGGFTPLSQQDPAGWDSALMTEAEDILRAAARLGQAGRFQLEAAIQAVHADRRRSGITDWPEILLLYEGLVSITPMIGAQVGRAAAMAASGNPEVALVALDRIDPARIADHQPYWATRAHALAGSGHTADAAAAYQRAAGLAEHPAMRAWLLQRSTSLKN